MWDNYEHLVVSIGKDRSVMVMSVQRGSWIAGYVCTDLVATAEHFSKAVTPICFPQSRV